MTSKTWVYVALVGLCVAFVVALTSRAKWIGVADASEERAAALSLEVDRLRDLNVELQEAVEMSDTVYVEVTREVTREVEVRDARAAELIAALRTRLDAVGDSLLTAYEAERDSIDAAFGRERAALMRRIETRNALIKSLHVEIATRAAENAELRAANEALRRAVAPTFLGRIFDSWETHAAVAGVGFLVGALK